jgi:hypothetical protein
MENHSMQRGKTHTQSRIVRRTACFTLGFFLLLTPFWLWAAPASPPDGTIVKAGNKGSYQWGGLSQVLPPDTLPVSTVPQPPGVKDTLVGPNLPNRAIQTSKWWTSLIFKRSTQASVPMNIINPGPLSIWSIPAGVGCRQNYYAYPNPLPPLNQGQPGLHPTTALTAGAAFNEVVAGIGISNNGYGFDQIGGMAEGYGPATGHYPNTAVVEYSTWAVTYDTLYKNTPFGQGSSTAPRLRTTIARGSPYLWVEYPDGYPSPQDKPGYTYPAGSPNFPFLQVQFTDPDLNGKTSTVIYLPPSTDYTRDIVDKTDHSNWIQNPVNNNPGTKNAGASANAIAFTVNGRNYAAFGPPGTWWTWVYDENFQGITKLLLTYGTYNPATRPYIVVAALPQNLNLGNLAPADLWNLVGKFKQYAFKRPGNSGPSWQQLGTLFKPTYPDMQGPNSVTGAFIYNLVEVGTGKPVPDDTTLFALLPHQQAHLQTVQAPDISPAQPFGSVYAQSYQYTGSRGFAANQQEFNNPNFYHGKHNGQMRLAEGKKFVLQYMLQPVLAPVLPKDNFTGRLDRLQGCLEWDFRYAWGGGVVAGNDSYGWGKLVSAVANNLMLAEAVNWQGLGGFNDLTGYLGQEPDPVNHIQPGGLVRWLSHNAGQIIKGTPNFPNCNQPAVTGFVYDPNWNVMLAFPPGLSGATPTPGFGTTTYLNDLHFHYGYFIRAAAVLAMYDPNFVANYGAMVEHLIRSIAADYDDKPKNPNGDDQAVYPAYRFFDPYTGSSSAAGAQQYSDGTNQESSSEAINAWYGMLLWAQVTKNNQMLDRAAYMYASEIDAARRYEFCEDAVTDNEFPLLSNTFSQLYDDSNQLALFFAQYKANPTDASPTLYAREAQHAINWLPFGGGSLYLSLNRAYAAMNYQGMINQPPGTAPYPDPVTPPYGDDWKWYIDLIWMYRSISNPAEAQQKVDAVLFPNPGATQPTPPPLPDNFLDNGDSTAFLYAWIYTLPNLGQPSLAVGSTYPLSAVYSAPNLGHPNLAEGSPYPLSAGSLIYWAFNPLGSPTTVKFSDNVSLTVPAYSYGHKIGLPPKLK